MKAQPNQTKTGVFLNLSFIALISNLKLNPDGKDS